MPNNQTIPIDILRKFINPDDAVHTKVLDAYAAVLEHQQKQLGWVDKTELTGKEKNYIMNGQHQDRMGEKNVN